MVVKDTPEFKSPQSGEKFSLIPVKLTLFGKIYGSIYRNVDTFDSLKIAISQLDSRCYGSYGFVKRDGRLDAEFYWIDHDGDQIKIITDADWDAFYEMFLLLKKPMEIFAITGFICKVHHFKLEDCLHITGINRKLSQKNVEAFIRSVNRSTSAGFIRATSAITGSTETLTPTHDENDADGNVTLELNKPDGDVTKPNKIEPESTAKLSDVGLKDTEQDLAQAQQEPRKELQQKPQQESQQDWGKSKIEATESELKASELIKSEATNLTIKVNEMTAQIKANDLNNNRKRDISGSIKSPLLPLNPPRMLRSISSTSSKKSDTDNSNNFFSNNSDSNNFGSNNLGSSNSGAKNSTPETEQRSASPEIIPKVEIIKRPFSAKPVEPEVIKAPVPIIPKPTRSQSYEPEVIPKPIEKKLSFRGNSYDPEIIRKPAENPPPFRTEPKEPFTQVFAISKPPGYQNSGENPPPFRTEPKEPFFVASRTQVFVASKAPAYQNSGEKTPPVRPPSPGAGTLNGRSSNVSLAARMERGGAVVVNTSATYEIMGKKTNGNGYSKAPEVQKPQIKSYGARNSYSVSPPPGIESSPYKSSPIQKSPLPPHLNASPAPFDDDEWSD